MKSTVFIKGTVKADIYLVEYISARFLCFCMDNL